MAAAGSRGATICAVAEQRPGRMSACQPSSGKLSMQQWSCQVSGAFAGVETPDTWHYIETSCCRTVLLTARRAPPHPCDPVCRLARQAVATAEAPAKTEAAKKASEYDFVTLTTWLLRVRTPLSSPCKTLTTLAPSETVWR